MKFVLPLALVGVVILFAWLVLDWGLPQLWPHRWAIVRAFDGNVDHSGGGNYRFDCGWAGCAEIMQELPAATWANCSHRLVRAGALVRPGACCIAEFGSLYQSEVHVFREADGTYTLQATVPYCRNANYDPSASRGSVSRQRFVPCFEHWGLEPPPVATR